MIPPTFRLIGRGVYSLREANRLTGVPVRRIRRWVMGYEHEWKGSRRLTPPVIKSDLPGELGIPAIDFVDLLEIRLLNAFREHGVSWRAIRIASERARSIMGTERPFSNQRFSTDGRVILSKFVAITGDECLIDLVHNQYEFERVVSEYLVGEIAFDDRDNPARWWPFQGSRRIVIDPRRSFGAPIVDAEGVPTRVLARAVHVEDNVELVAEIYNVDPVSVAEAFRYEVSRAML